MTSVAQTRVIAHFANRGTAGAGKTIIAYVAVPPTEKLVLKLRLLAQPSLTIWNASRGEERLVLPTSIACTMV